MGRLDRVNHEKTVSSDTQNGIDVLNIPRNARTGLCTVCEVGEQLPVEQHMIGETFNQMLEPGTFEELLITRSARQIHQRQPRGFVMHHRHPDQGLFGIGTVPPVW